MLALALSLTSAGCLNFQEPGELAPRDAELAVSVTVTDSSPLSAELQGQLLRPRGEDGRLTALADPVIRLLGHSVAPEQGQDEDILLYGDEWTVAPGADARRRIELEGPVVDEGRSRLSLAFPLVRRAGPDSLSVAPDEDLRLPLDPGDEGAYGSVSSLSWQLVVTAEGSPASLVSMRASGRPPDTLRVQPELLEPAPAGAVLRVQFWIRMHAARTGASLPYEMRLDAQSVVEWRVGVE